MSLSVEKLNKNNANRYFHILHDTNAWKINGRIKLGKCFIENLTFTNQLCLGKALFKNYLDKDDFVYMVKVYATKSQEQPKLQNMLCEAVLVLPVDVEKVVKKNRRLEYEDVAVTTETPFSSSVPSSTIISSTGKFTPTTQLTTITALSTLPKSTLITTLISPTKTTEKSVTFKPETTTPFEEVTTNKTHSHVNSTSSTQTEEDNNPIVYYCITGFSLIGTAIFGYGIKRLLSKHAQTHNSSLIKYENIHNEELLDDFSEANSSFYF
ncbi:hypothetical protein FQR65_LT00568 [Abscondita terminalis]|nr:hypothetical protein FQR65_LT00568 [Abscondita terminalis]